MLTESQKDSIKYFWLEKGDIKRYVDWDKVQADLAIEAPTLYFALQTFFSLKGMIDVCIKNDIWA